MKTVAIVGSHPRTRDAFDFDRTDCDIWVFNEAMAQDWCTRADAVFQLHEPVVFRSKTNRNDPNHYEWLKRTDIPMIYMQEQYDDVPNSVRYPLEQVVALTPGYEYLTSSVAYAIALAILQGYERIELYGAEMETNTEYGHQRQGMAFWIGVALGRGIDVEHVSPTFWLAPLCAYSGNERIDIEHYRARIDQLTEARKGAQEAHDQAMTAIHNLIRSFVKDYKTDQSLLDEYILRVGQSGHDFGAVDGALQVNEQYLERCEIMLEESGTYLIVRQELESKTHAGMKEKDERYREVFVKADRLQEARKRLKTNANREEREKLAHNFFMKLSDYIKASTMTGIGGGIMAENAHLMAIYDKLQAAENDKPEPINLEPDMAEDVAVLEGELENMSHHR